MENNDHKSLVQKQFGRSASDYANSDVHAAGESLALLLEMTQPLKHWHVLDIATGAGHTALAFAPYVQQVIACDITQAMLDTTSELASQRGIDNVETKLTDAEELPFENDSFDLVTCRLAFHHFQNQNQALAEVVRVLKPDGVFGFTDNYTVDANGAAEFYNRFERIRDPSHHQVHSLQALTKLFGKHGLQISQSKLLSKEFEFQEWANRQRVSDSDKTKLLNMLDHCPVELLDLLKPRKDQTTAYFSLAETVLLANAKLN